LLDVERVTKRFGGLMAVNGASLHVAQREIVALIGPNGAGKTTLFAIVSGFERPDEGSVALCGERISGFPPQAICSKGLVRTFQIVQPFAGLTVRENIAVGAHLHARRRNAALAAAEEIATRVGLGPQLDKPARALTVAARKRLELARALATRPKLLLLDEVMAGLNPTEIGDIVEIVRSIRAAGVTILLIEHVMQAVMRLADRVYALNQGSIIAEGTPGEIAANSQVIEAYLGQARHARG
jgi:branched-chain amino acid transport system ATP-binding protein